MASPKQIAANCRNAQHSTGPRSAAGKATVRFNAIESGIYAERETVLPSEDPSALSALTAEYFAHFRPASPAERCLVDSLIADEWLLRRFRRIEGELMTRSCQDVEGLQAERFAIGTAYEEHSRTLERLQRRINATHKAYLKTLQILNEIRATEEARLQAQRDEVARFRAAASIQPDQQLTPAIGFVPSNVPEPVPEVPQTPLRSPIHLVSGS